jgi:phosphohistidine phosphatase
MKALFIRHAKAIDRISWLKDDMQRPLSDKGVSSAKYIFKAISKIYETPNVVFTSEAARCRETAHIFMKYFSGSALKSSPLLNPGADIEGIKSIFSQNIGLNFVVFIGHEPDLSEIVSELLGNKNMIIDFRKCAIAELEIDDGNTSSLKALIPPKLFT